MAAGRISIKVRSNRISDVARLLPEAAAVIVKRNGEQAAQRARAIVPVDTGALQASIRFEMTGQTEGRLSAGGGGISYAGFVEFGTARMSARPFLGQAAADQEAQFLDDFRRIEDALR